jgi:exosome complex component RRP4
VSGEIDRVSKLISVKAPRTRYTAEVGDVVVGRIIEVSNKRWRVDCNARQDSSLLLSAIHLPGVIQRRKSESDELQMRCFFAEGEVLVAEVQMLYHDGAFGIHTRNLKYGKLVAGELIIVKASLVRRSRSHFVVTAWGVEIILGLNGYIWVGKPRKLPDEQDLDALYSRDLGPISKAELDAIARTRNCIVALDSKFKIIDEDSISRLYHATCSIPAHNILCLESLEY